MRLTLALAGVALACMAPAANAATYLITYTGTVTGGADSLHLFGSGLRSFYGKAFTAEFTVTVPTPGADYISDDQSFSLYQGQDAANPVQGTLTIGDVSLNFGDFMGSVYRTDEDP